MKRWAVTKHIGKVEPDDLLHMATALYLKVGAIHTLDKKWFPYHDFLQRPIGYPEAPTSGAPHLIPGAPPVPILGAGDADGSEIIDADQ